jgi:hypothetical protein
LAGDKQPAKVYRSSYLREKTLEKDWRTWRVGDVLRSAVDSPTADRSCTQVKAARQGKRAADADPSYGAKAASGIDVGACNVHG